MSTDFDAIVVGGGVAGCVVAQRLRARHDRVLVIEAGRAAAHEPVPPVDIFAALPGHVHEGVLARRTPAQGLTPYLSGAGLGGGSLVNGLLVVGDPVGVPVPAASADEGCTTLERRILPGSVSWSSAVFLGPGRPRLADLTRGCSVLHARVGSASPRGAVLTDGGSVSASEVVVCAGALESPRLLRRSGFEGHGVGTRLRDHASVCFTVPGTFGFSASGRASTLVGRSASGDLMYTSFAGEPGLLLVTLLRCRSQGWLEDGHAELNLLTDLHDRTTLRAGVRVLLACAADLAPVGPDGRNGRDLLAATDADLDDWMLRNEGGTYHATGTCAIGAALLGDATVRGAAGLRVIDASALAESPRGTPMAPVLRLAAALA